jgi:hypothetical protein
MLPLLLTGILAAPAPLLAPDAGAIAPNEGASEEPTLYGAVELSGSVLPSGGVSGQLDGFGVAHPVFGFRVSDVFALELGPTLRFRVADLPPLQRSEDFGQVLRRQDWDSPSDYGQILSSLRVGTEVSPVQLRAGALLKKTLGHGHLVSRYSNQDNPDTHPAGAVAVLRLGPTRTELIASDLLAARVFAGEVAWDIGRTFSPKRELADRYQLALGLATDLARGEPPRPLSATGSSGEALFALQRATLLQLDFSAVVYRSSRLRLMLEAGAGSRANRAGDLGFLLGIATDAQVQEIALGARVELRKQAGGFRHAYFGPGYELARFSATGFSGVPLAQEVLPDGFSVAVDLRTAVGTSLSLDVALEQFSWGRTDFDLLGTLALWASKLAATARLTATALGQAPRFAFTAGVRLRLRPAIYVVGAGGTVFFPQPDGGLVRGITASLGVGFDFQR